MAINNPYVPGDPFSYDLKWIVAKLKEYGIFIEGAPATIQALIDEVIKEMSLPTEYINAKYPGHGLTGIKGDGIEDDTEVFRQLIEYCETKGLPLYLPADCTVLITEDLKMDKMTNVILQGTITGDPSVTLKMLADSHSVAPVTWDITDVEGVELRIEGVKNGLVRVQKASNLTLYAEGGTDYSSIAYSTFLLGNIGELVFNGDSSGWINSNVFIGGRITTGITFDGNYGHNNNVFYGLLFEGDTFLTMNIGNTNQFYDTRGEGTITYSFGIRAYNNLVTLKYTGGTPFVRIPRLTYQDDNGTNLIAYAGQPFCEITSLTLNREQGTFSTQDIRKGSPGMMSANSSGTVMITDLIDISSPIWFMMDSDASNWRYRVMCFDENGTQITTEPATSPVYGGSITWNGTAQAYQPSSNAETASYGFCKVIGGTDTGVKYVKILIRANAGAAFDHLTASIMRCQNAAPASFHYAHQRIEGSAAPTAGTWDLGDVVWNTAPTAGGKVGWVCTTAGSPGTWKQFGDINS